MFPVPSRVKTSLKTNGNSAVTTIKLLTVHFFIDRNTDDVSASRSCTYLFKNQNAVTVSNHNAVTVSNQNVDTVFGFGRGLTSTLWRC